MKSDKIKDGQNGFSYVDYVKDKPFLEGYNEYQKKYAKKIRESDKVIINLVHDIIKSNSTKKFKLLDIGCSTGNLLLHLKKLFPDLHLTGCDMAVSSLDECKNNPSLNGIYFEEKNILDLGYADEFDIIIINAVFYLFSLKEFDLSLFNVSKALKSGGYIIVFDFFHPYEQDLSIFEKSRTHPEGLMLHFRPQLSTQEFLKKNKFTNVKFLPFEIPVDLEKPASCSDISTYTIRFENGKKGLFRGTLYQPWCHLTAQKS